MLLPRALARFNRRVTNPLLGRLVGRAPALAFIVHRGRRSGREHRTPVAAFSSGDEVIIALTYGPGADWVRNLLAAGGGRLVRRGRAIPLVQPRLIETSAPPPALPALVRLALRLLGTRDYLLLTQGEDNEWAVGGSQRRYS